MFNPIILTRLASKSIDFFFIFFIIFFPLAQSWFETEKQTAETEGMATDDTPQETLQPSVPTGSDEDSRCQVCHDAFEQFYNEEKEEWHLRPAVNYEKRNYHPLCLEDYKRALEKTALALEEAVSEIEESKKECTEETSGNEQEKSNVEISNKELEPVENSEQIEEGPLETVTSETEEKSANIENSEVTQVEVEEKEKMEDAIEENTVTADTKENAPAMYEEEKSLSEGVTTPFENIKIKEEPLDDIGEQDNSDMFAFLDKLEHQIKEEPMEPEPEPEPDPEQIVNESGTVDTTYAAVKSSIDGNVELDSTPALVPAAPSRIKINITKPLNSNKESEENKEKEKTTVETSVEENAEQPLIPASIKPSLQGRKLSNLPPVEKGQELSGLCSIM